MECDVETPKVQCVESRAVEHAVDGPQALIVERAVETPPMQDVDKIPSPQDEISDYQPVAVAAPSMLILVMGRYNVVTPDDTELAFQHKLEEMGYGPDHDGCQCCRYHSCLSCNMHLRGFLIAFCPEIADVYETGRGQLVPMPDLIDWIAHIPL